jgi:energy coupling factor transporter S component ThiW
MSHKHLRKIVVSGMLMAVIIALSGFYIPVGASKCFPIQHLVNVLAAVLLGPWWGVAIAFCASLLRNLMGTGTLLAFPGSMAGALLCGIMYHYTGRLSLTCAAEVVGTGIVGGLLAYPVAVFLLGREAALFAFVMPFLISTAGGSLAAAFLVKGLERSRALSYMRERILNRR